MFDEPPEHRGFKFRSGFVVNCHDRISTVNLAVSRKLIDPRWGVVTDFTISTCKERVNRRDFGCRMPENAPLAVDSRRQPARNHQ
jgi:hypothetical protein